MGSSAHHGLLAEVQSPVGRLRLVGRLTHPARVQGGEYIRLVALIGREGRTFSGQGGDGCVSKGVGGGAQGLLVSLLHECPEGRVGNKTLEQRVGHGHFVEV